MKISNKLCIVGAGGHGKVVADAAKSMSLFDEIVFLDDRDYTDSLILDIPIVGKLLEQPSAFFSSYSFIVAIGNNVVRAKIFDLILSLGGEIVNIVHKSAVVSNFSNFSKGIFVGPGAVVNADAQIGCNAIINSGAIVEHDCVVGDHTHVAPNAVLTGGCQIGGYSLLGAGAVVIPCKQIGSNTTIGAGSVVIHDVDDNIVVYGSPAKMHG